jgi:hypothetical protein
MDKKDRFKTVGERGRVPNPGPIGHERGIHEARTALAMLLAALSALAVVGDGSLSKAADSGSAGSTLRLEGRRDKSDEADWMAAIRLPDVDPFGEGVEGPLAPPPQSSDRVAEEAVRSAFLSASDALTRELSVKDDLAARRLAILEFLGDRFAEARHAQSAPGVSRIEMGSAAFFAELDRLNTILFPGGHYVSFSLRPDEGVEVGVFKVEGMGRVRLEGKAVPVAWMRSDHSWSTEKEAPPPHFNGTYLQGLGMVVLDRQGIEGQIKVSLEELRARCGREGAKAREFDPETLRRDLLASAAAHEAGHLWLSAKVRYEPLLSDALRRSGDIPMGRYGLPHALCAKADNAQIHELVAHGIGLAHSGEAATLVAHGLAMDTHQPNYVLARDVLWRELTYCDEIDATLRRKVLDRISGTNKIPLDPMDVLVNQAPPSALRKIGERMAKLGLHLTEK